ncbi:MAG: hypothetical protein H7A55_12195 [Verrucomicrobiaceae bacterium]|nr:hypothetical protein [Verrucomicrobiaceae bacterium]
MTGSQTLTDQYTRALRKLETELAASGDYEQALAVQHRNDELTAIYAKADGALAQSLSVPLSAATAKLSGVSAAEDGSLSGWRTVGSGAEWTSLKITPGDFNLEFDYTMGDVPVTTPSSSVTARQMPVDRALFDFYEASLLAGASDNRRSFELSRTPDPTKPGSQRVGPVHFTRSPITLRLSATNGYPANVIRFSNLRLVPVDAAPTGTAAALVDPGEEIQKLRAAFAAELAKAREPLILSQKASLITLQSQHPDIAAEIRAEIARLSKQEGKGGANEPRLPRPIAALSGLAGFQDFNDARYVAAATNTGDRFSITHEGQTYDIRLLWIACAPLSGASEESHARNFTKHFGIDPADAPLFARAAQEFTAGYLEGKLLRVLIRSAKDSSGAYPALVFVEPIGLYQNVLIGQGLAAVLPLPAGKRTLMETALHGAMKDREDDARKRRPPPGAWAIGKPEKKQPTAKP